MNGPTPEFWQSRYQTGQTGWDRGGPSPQLLAWLDQGVLSPCRVLVPGCGAGWEVAELARRGFEVVGLDYADAALERARQRCRALGVHATLHPQDVLAHTPESPYDAVYEQTCWCALHPDHWAAYAARLQAWVRPGGRLCALFLQALRPAASDSGHIEGPPYHCDINAVRALLPTTHWTWPAPPYPRVAHPNLAHELALVLQRRSDA